MFKILTDLFKEFNFILLKRSQLRNKNVESILYCAFNRKKIRIKAPFFSEKALRCGFVLMCVSVRCVERTQQKRERTKGKGDRDCNGLRDLRQSQKLYAQYKILTHKKGIINDYK